MGLGDALRHGAERHPQKLALVTPERSWSFADLDAASSRLAAALLHAGPASGDRIALHFTNGYELPVCLYACFKAGQHMEALTAYLEA